MARPVLFVLAGVNGAGKSSIGGHVIERAGRTWFNPDTFARELVALSGCSQEEANALAWQESLRRLDQAIAHRVDYAFETTLGGRTVARRILAAARSHDVILWFCGLSSPELHIERVRARVKAGGHDIPEAKIRERSPNAIANVIALMPHVAQLQVHDNSAHAEPGQPVPDPLLVLEVVAGRIITPAKDDAAALAAVPDWAKPIVEAALS
jgi:predicted ABC-type ATPase